MRQPRWPIFWLLLAATICIDAMAFSRAHSSSMDANLGAEIFRAVICDALIVGQLSVVCIWAMLGTNRLLWSPVLSALLAAVVAGALFDDSSADFLSKCRLFFSIYGLETACLLVGLWLLRGLQYSRQRAGGTVWRFSVAQLLIVMTAAAVLATMLRTGPFADEGKGANIGFAVCIVAMSLASAVIWGLSAHWLLRLAATLGVALVLGFLSSYLVDFGAPSFYVISAYFLVQAIVLSAWLGWGPILSDRASVATSGDGQQLLSKD